MSVDRAAVQHLDQHLPVVARLEEVEQPRIVRALVHHLGGAALVGARPPVHLDREPRSLETPRRSVRLTDAGRLPRLDQEPQRRGRLPLAAVAHPQRDQVEARLRPLVRGRPGKRRRAVAEIPPGAPHRAGTRVLELDRLVRAGTAELLAALCVHGDHGLRRHRWRLRVGLRLRVGVRWRWVRVGIGVRWRWVRVGIGLRVGLRLRWRSSTAAWRRTTATTVVVLNRQGRRAAAGDPRRQRAEGQHHRLPVIVRRVVRRRKHELLTRHTAGENNARGHARIVGGRRAAMVGALKRHQHVPLRVPVEADNHRHRAALLRLVAR